MPKFQNNGINCRNKRGHSGYRELDHEDTEKTQTEKQVHSHKHRRELITKGLVASNDERVITYANKK